MPKFFNVATRYRYTGKYSPYSSYHSNAFYSFEVYRLSLWGKFKWWLDRREWANLVVFDRKRKKHMVFKSFEEFTNEWAPRDTPRVMWL